MSKKPGNLFGGMLLIAGSCIGAGMLGLPVITGIAGLGPSLIMFVCVWLFMTLTGLLLVEANGWFSRKVNFMSIVGHSLGKGGKFFCLVMCLFLFYALLVAYISGSGSLLSSLLLNGLQVNLAPWIGSLAFVAIFGLIVYAGTRKVDLVNRALMVFKILFFLALVTLGASFIQPELLLFQDASSMIFSMPLLVISFGFHNMIPSLTSYMNNDLKRVRAAIIGGSLLAFLIYLIWEVLVLGVVPIEGPNGLIEMLHLGKEGAQALVAVLHSPLIALSAQGLAFFAILTSFLAQALSLVHFLADGFQVKTQKTESPLLCLLVLLPPLIMSLLWPSLFFQALNFAGGFCAVLLFGILPVLVVWSGRYQKRIFSTYKVFGGKALLIFIFASASFIFLFQLLNTAGVVSLSKVGLSG